MDFSHWPNSAIRSFHFHAKISEKKIEIWGNANKRSSNTSIIHFQIGTWKAGLKMHMQPILESCASCLHFCCYFCIHIESYMCNCVTRKTTRCTQRNILCNGKTRYLILWKNCGISLRCFIFPSLLARANQLKQILIFAQKFEISTGEILCRLNLTDISKNTLLIQWKFETPLFGKQNYLSRISSTNIKLSRA